MASCWATERDSRVPDAFPRLSAASLRRPRLSAAVLAMQHCRQGVWGSGAFSHTSSEQPSLPSRAAPVPKAHLDLQSLQRRGPYSKCRLRRTQFWPPNAPSLGVLIWGSTIAANWPKVFLGAGTYCIGGGNLAYRSYQIPPNYRQGSSHPKGSYPSLCGMLSDTHTHTQK